MPTINMPDYGGGSIVNLVATIEARLTGSAPGPVLHDHLATLVPNEPGYVLVVFDGLGSRQLEHPAITPIAAARVADLDTVFPSTTTVALASLATGQTPAEHGLLGYQLWMPELGAVANTIKWTTLWGAPLDYDTGALLPAPNLWERLREAGVDAVTVQSATFDRSQLTRALYRGCRFEPAADGRGIVAATAASAGPGRLVVAYVPFVDFAAHVYGQSSKEYARAINAANDVWHRMETLLPEKIALLGTSDHGHIDFPPDRQHKIPKTDHADRVFYGDGRAMFVRGDAASLADDLPATWVEIDEARMWWGRGPTHPEFDVRAPDGILIADDDSLLLHRFSDDRMIGSHGAMTADEQLVPLLIR